MVRKSKVLLSELKLRHHLRVRHRSKKRMEWLTRLEVNRSVLYLQQHIGCEFTVKRTQVFISCAGPVITGLHVVDKRSPDYNAVMRSNSSCQHVCTVCVRAIVSARSRLPFTIGLDHKATKIGNSLIDFVTLFLPPGQHFRI